MRKCKQTDVQALDSIAAELKDIAVHYTMLTRRLNSLQRSVQEFQLHGDQEYNDVQTTHGPTAENG